jgi:hypothetical protein
VNTQKGVMMCVEILCDSINIIDEHSHIHNFCIDDIDGILLTPEVLDKCEGFVKDEDYSERNQEWHLEMDNCFQATLNLNDFSICYSFFKNANVFEHGKFKIEGTLHYLQNAIYFITKGKEIKYKP